MWMRKCVYARLPNRLPSRILVPTMKNRIGVIVLVLVLVCAGLGIALIAIKKQTAAQELDFAVKSGALSNSWMETRETVR